MSWDDIDKSIDLSIKFGSKNINRIKNHCYYYDCGDDELILGFYDKAIQYFNVAIKFKPDNSEYYYKRTEAYLGLKRYEEAIQDFSKAIELKPNNSEYYYKRSKAYAGLKQ